MLTKIELESLREEAELALAPIAEKYNCEVHAGNITYSDVSAKLSVKFDSKGPGNISAEQNLFNAYCIRYGFKPEDYRKHFIMNGHDYILVGFNISARKNFCILERDGKEFVCAPEMLMRNFKGE